LSGTANSWKRLWKACGYSLAGLHSAWQQEAAFRLEIYLLIPLLPAALFLGKTRVEKAILIASLLLVLIMELLNSAIEALADRFGAEWHELIKRAKDCGSAAVLIAVVQVVMVWGLVLF
jgi:diacylglycerol kinase (ATP)